MPFKHPRERHNGGHEETVTKSASAAHAYDGGRAGSRPPLFYLRDFRAGFFARCNFPAPFFAGCGFALVPLFFCTGDFSPAFAVPFFEAGVFAADFFDAAFFTEDFPAADFSALRVPLFTARSAFALFFTALFFAREAAADLPGASFFPFPENAYSITSSARVTGINAMPAFT